MESTLNDLKNRRSIRSYKPEQIKGEELQKILEAGTYAPTGMGRQSPKIVVVQDKETRDLLSRLNAKYFPGASEEMDPFYGAPTGMPWAWVPAGSTGRERYSIHRKGKNFSENGGLRETISEWDTVSWVTRTGIFLRRNREKKTMWSM